MSNEKLSAKLTETLKQAEIIKQLKAQTHLFAKALNILRATSPFAEATTKKDLARCAADAVPALKHMKLKGKIDSKN